MGTGRDAGSADLGGWPTDTDQGTQIADGGAADLRPTGAVNGCSPDNWCWENPLLQGNILSGVWGIGKTDLWVVGWSGTIIRYSATGWALQSSGTLENLASVWGADASNVWAVGGSGTILKWNGAAWTAQTSGTTKYLYGVWGTDKNNVWAVGGSGTILKWNQT